MRVTVTGHRPQRLNGHTNKVRDWLQSELGKINCIEAYSGMAIGTDQIFAKVAIDMNIPLICCFPYKRDKFHPIEKRIMDNAADIRFISENFSKQAYWLRDKYLVDNCDVLLAVWDGIETGGTWLTVDYARKVGRKIIYYPYNLKKE